jgi:ribosomal protein S18 acetylase RimI-like enzyme
MKVYPRHDIQRLVSFDYRREMTIVGVVGQIDAEKIVGMARYTRDEESVNAEIDFAVHPEYGRKGIASLLIQHLAEIARSQGVKSVSAYVSPGNERVFGVFQKLGYLVETSLVEGVYEIRVHFDRPALVCLTD